MVDGKRPKILLCLSGSVSVVKIPQLAVMLAEFAEVKIVVTEASKHFLNRSQAYNGPAHAAFALIDPPIPVLGDADEWGAWDAVGDPVLHIELRKWADLMLVAPLSANTLAKLANGLCDNLVGVRGVALLRFSRGERRASSVDLEGPGRGSGRPRI
eukprot:jgi/Undpi1/4714/HiC_scaffold_18.g08067.m1